MSNDKKELGITKGEWTVERSTIVYVGDGAWAIECAPFNNTSEEKKLAEANAKLIADAGTTANKTGKLPSQLAEENEMLLGALKGIIEIGKRNMENPKYDGYFQSAEHAIATAEGKTNT